MHHQILKRERGKKEAQDVHRDQHRHVRGESAQQEKDDEGAELTIKIMDKS